MIHGNKGAQACHLMSKNWDFTSNITIERVQLVSSVPKK